jgi:hypothetical protein
VTILDRIAIGRKEGNERNGMDMKRGRDDEYGDNNGINEHNHSHIK